MGELHDLIGIHGAIDRAVAADPGRRASVSQLLPVYQREGAPWFDDFAAWIDEKRGGAEGEAFPSLEEALERLGRTEATGHMRARRMFALALAAQAFPELLLEPQNERTALARGALRVDGLARGDGEAARLLQLLGEGLEQPPVGGGAPVALDSWWESVIAACDAEGLIDDPEWISPRPCSGRLVMAPFPGGRVPAATLMTVWETDRIPFKRATSFLEPVHWPKCCAFWCTMTRLKGAADAGHHSFHEVVSTDCDAWTIEADLDFSFTKSDGLAITEYQLSAGHPQEGDDVEVDEGSLVVQRLGPAAAAPLRVTTTKRIRFARFFSGEQLALIMCALGYAEVVKELVFSCAALPGKKTTGTPFPGRALGAVPDAGTAAPPITSVAGRAAAEVKDCIDDYTAAARASSETIRRGEYTADALVKDLTGLWGRVLRDAATAVDAGARTAGTAARTRPRTGRPAREEPPS